MSFSTSKLLIFVCAFNVLNVEIQLAEIPSIAKGRTLSSTRRAPGKAWLFVQRPAAPAQGSSQKKSVPIDLPRALDGRENIFPKPRTAKGPLMNSVVKQNFLIFFNLS